MICQKGYNGQKEKYEKLPDADNNSIGESDTYICDKIVKELNMR